MLTVCWLTEDQIKRKSLYVLLDAVAKLYDDQKSAIHLTVIGGNGNGLDSLTTYVENLNLLDQVEIIVDADDAEKSCAINNQIFTSRLAFRRIRKLGNGSHELWIAGSSFWLYCSARSCWGKWIGFAADRYPEHSRKA